MSEYTAELSEMLLTTKEPEQHIVIAADRSILVPDELKEIAVQFDKNIETVVFDCPRYWDEHDLSTMNIYINYQCADGRKDCYPCENVEVDVEDDHIIHFAWTLDDGITCADGVVVFLVCAKKSDENGVLKNRWNSKRCTDFTVLEGLDIEITEEELVEHQDFIDNMFNRMKSAVAAAGEAAEKAEESAERILKDVEAIKSDALVEVANATAGAVQTLENTGAAQVNAVNQASEAKKAEINSLDLVQEIGQLSAAVDTKGPAIVESASGEVITLCDASDQPIRGLRVFGRSEQHGEPAPEYPQEIVSVGDDGAVDVYANGKNLFYADINNPVDVAYKANESASPTNRLGFVIELPPGEYTISTPTKTASGNYLYGAVIKKSNIIREWSCNVVANTAVTTHTIAITPGTALILYDGSSDSTAERVAALFTKFPIQIEIGSVETEYEPPKSQSLPISTPNGLPGIPVASGGNYTDSTGQRWVCDEIDFGRGVYVQRIAAITWDGKSVKATARNSTSKNNMYYTDVEGILAGTEYSSFIRIYCTHMTNTTFLKLFEGSVVGISAYPNQSRLAFGFGLDSPLTTVDQVNAWMAEQYSAGTPMTAVYQLAEPIETPLTEAELTAYRSLHTNKPNTTVYTDEGAGVEVSYAADTKTYIDNKFSELAAAIINN